jgi:hypothetical protein
LDHLERANLSLQSQNPLKSTCEIHYFVNVIFLPLLIFLVTNIINILFSDTVSVMRAEINLQRLDFYFIQSLTPRGEDRLTVSENGILRTIFAPKTG